MVLLHQTIELACQLRGRVTDQLCLHAPSAPGTKVADCPEQSEAEMAERRHDRAYNPAGGFDCRRALVWAEVSRRAPPAVALPPKPLKAHEI